MLQKKIFLPCLFTLSCLMSPTHIAHATMGGVSTIGPLLTPGESSTAIREVIDLKKSGDLLIAKPHHGLVAMIALYAPGLNQGHLILRELLTPDGRQTLLLTAPDAVKAKVHRATLYTKGLPDNIVLLENINGIWQERLPQPFLTDSIQAGSESAQVIKAFPIKTLGFYWLLESTAGVTVSAHAPEKISATTLMGGNFTSGIFPSVIGILLFMLFGTVSRYIHKTEKLGGL